MAAERKFWDEANQQTEQEGKQTLQPVAPVRPVARVIPTPGPRANFEEALQETLDENQELYRRLA